MLATVTTGELTKVGGAACRMECFTPGLSSLFLARWLGRSLQRFCAIRTFFAPLETYHAVSEYRAQSNGYAAFCATLKQLARLHPQKLFISVTPRCHVASIPICKADLLRYRSQWQT